MMKPPPNPVLKALEVLREHYGSIVGIELKGWQSIDNIHTVFLLRLRVRKRTVRAVVYSEGGKFESYRIITRSEKRRLLSSPYGRRKG